jgi:hypothetical protein
MCRRRWTEVGERSGRYGWRHIRIVMMMIPCYKIYWRRLKDVDKGRQKGNVM